MIIIEIDFKNKQLISQMGKEIIAEEDSEDTYYYWEPWAATPSIGDFAKLHPRQTVRVGLSSKAIGDELICFTKALDIGGYRRNAFSLRWHQKEFAKRALIEDLAEIAWDDLNIVDFDYKHEDVQGKSGGEDALIATFVFKNRSDRERFRYIAKYKGFRVVEDDTRLD